MSIPGNDARALVAALTNPDLADYVAQAEARHVLLEVGEAPENFPPFVDALEDKVTGLAYAHLAAGCSLVEQHDRPEGAPGLERAARLLRSVHGPTASTSKESAFHILLASMAAYAAGQYSWAFVMLKTVAPLSETATLVAAFLRRDRKLLQAAIAGSVFDSDRAFEHDDDLADAAMARAVARALANTMEFVFTGHAPYLDLARRELADASTIAMTTLSPAWWWIVRLLKLMIGDLEGASPWTVLPPLTGLGREDATLNAYVRLLAFDDVRPAYELWRSQRDALPQALGTNSGAVISLRTSGGKTRVAELAMLKTLKGSPTAKILFLAPFRSLAFEMEQTLSSTFRPLGYEISHLYGGARANRSDTELASEANVIVATPEKARALFRATPELFFEIQLIVIDEGHLIGGNFRDVRNEMYYEHLRVRARHNGARILLLSAALPNAQSIAEWIASAPTHVGESTWRPSIQRFGLLRWDGSRVMLEWKGDYPSSNPRFVVAASVNGRKKARRFPATYNDAIGATAVRLHVEGRPVMIFVAQARSVGTMAKSVLQALVHEQKTSAANWPEREWKAFEAICNEELPEGAIELEAARLGVMCHSNSLPAQVRLAMEHLMRSRALRIVIATKTLAQGVNLGVTTVIVASTLMDKSTFVEHGDFLNIAGRAGRAFVDVEGKVLFGINETEPAKIRAQEGRASKYLDGSAPNPVVSGVLQVINHLKMIALQAGVSFDRLLELAAEDDFRQLGQESGQAGAICDLLDDALLSLHEDGLLNELSDPPEVWVEKLFRESLAALQAAAISTSHSVTSREVVQFLQSRAKAALRIAATPEKRRAIVSSSLPFKVAVRMFDDIDAWKAMVDTYVAAGESFDAFVSFLNAAESWATANASSLIERPPTMEALAAVRRGWLAGIPLRNLCKGDKDLHGVCRDYYGFQLTWIVHAASQEIRAAGDDERADVLSRLSLCIELGLPTEYSCRVFLAGVRSRAAAVEISQAGINLGDSIRTITRSLREETVALELSHRLAGSPYLIWLDLIGGRRWRTSSTVPRFPPFTLPGMSTDDSLVARNVRGRVRLSSIDGRRFADVGTTAEFPFNAVANDPRYCFRFRSGAWHLDVRDPRLQQP